MSKAIELAKSFDAFFHIDYDNGGEHEGYEFSEKELETFFRRAQAMALREAAREFRKGDPAPKHWAVLALEQKANELEAGK